MRRLQEMQQQQPRRRAWGLPPSQPTTAQRLWSSTWRRRDYDHYNRESTTKSETSNLQAHYWRVLLPLARLLSTSGAHYNSIGVFTTTGQMAATTLGCYYQFSKGWGLSLLPWHSEGVWNYRQCHYLRLPSPVSTTKPKTTGWPFCGSRKRAGAARALHYDYDYNDHRQRENENYEKTGGPWDYDDRSRYYDGMSSCVWLSSLQSGGGRKRDRLLWPLPQEHWHEEKGATMTQRLGWPLWLLPCRIDYRRGCQSREQRHRLTTSSDWLTDYRVCGQSVCVFTENTIKIVVSALFSKRKKGQKLTQLLSWKSVQVCVEYPSKYVAQHNWTDFQRNLFLFFSFTFGKISLFLQKEEIFGKTKTQRKFGLIFNKKRAAFGRIFNSTAYIYIYTHTYAGELFVCPLFCPFESYSFVHCYLKISSVQQPEAKWKLTGWPPESY